MPPFPRPIGIDVTLKDIATGIGEAARLLPTKSQSAIGAVALKTASVRIDFEMARASATDGSNVQLGLRTFGVGASQSRTATKDISRNNGSIQLEIVAITDVAPPPPPKPELKPIPQPPRRIVTPDRRLAALKQALAMLKTPQASAGLNAATRRKLQAAVKRLEAAIAKSDIDGAARVLATIPKILPPEHPFNQPGG
jgi:hypothetical protein